MIVLVFTIYAFKSYSFSFLFENLFYQRKNEKGPNFRLTFEGAGKKRNLAYQDFVIIEDKLSTR